MADMQATILKTALLQSLTWRRYEPKEASFSSSQERDCGGSSITPTFANTWIPTTGASCRTTIALSINCQQTVTGGNPAGK